MSRSDLKSIIFIMLILLTMPVLVSNVGRIQQLFSSASWLPAKIVVNTESNLGDLPKPWQALAQGGEEQQELMLSSAVLTLATLTPKYIRIDHMYDFYDVVSEKDGKMLYNFSGLDRTVDDILRTGAKPLLALSYMPKSLSSGGVTDQPLNWRDWQELVKKTVEHYSGKNGKNIDGVVYEVWNEPDLFGKWTIDGPKSYKNLYLYAALGAGMAQNVNSFEIGGPATTTLDKKWVEELINFSRENNLRLDFISWHSYSLNPQKFSDDADMADSLLTNYSAFYKLPEFITEWGSDSENSPFHDSNFDAAHTIAVIRQILGKVDYAFSFEAKDGPPPNPNKPFWGRWGILTHESAGLIKKPKFFALLLLNKLKGSRLSVLGEGSFVKAIAAKDDQITRVILSNYDPQSSHSETFTVQFFGLEKRDYKISQTNLSNSTTISKESVSQDSLTKTILLSPNEVILLELQPQ